jgi:membrane-associated protease RseP (regulator of RpoE activity)
MSRRRRKPGAATVASGSTGSLIDVKCGPRLPLAANRGQRPRTRLLSGPPRHMRQIGGESPVEAGMRRWMGLGLAGMALAVSALAVGAGHVRAGEEKDKADKVKGKAKTKIDRMGFMLGGGGAYLGVTLGDVGADEVTRLKLTDEQGAVVQSVKEDSPAEKAGLKDGDVILRYQGETVHSAAQLARLVRETPAGRKVALEISRDGTAQTLSATVDGHRGLHGLVEPFHFELDELADLPEPPEPPDPPAAPRAPRAPRFKMLGPNPPMAPFGEMDLRIDRLFPEGHKDVLREVIRSGRPGRLGIGYQELGGQLAAYFKVPEGSVLVSQVDADGPAGRAGLKAGDIILKVDGKAVEGDELRDLVRKVEPGSEVVVTVQRDGQAQDVRITLPKTERRAPRRGTTT